MKIKDNRLDPLEKISMFEFKPEDMTAGIFIDEKGYQVANANGISELKEGWQRLTFNEAYEIIKKMDRLLPSVYEKDQKRFQSVRNQIMFAFGPGMEEAL